MRKLWFAVVLVGCAQNAGPGVLGTPADLTIDSGSYVGYRVVHPCPVSPTMTVGIIGLGSVATPDVTAIGVKGDQLYAMFQDLPSVYEGGGYGLACESGVGTTVWTDDWRDVDTVITRTGTWLHDNDLDLAVTVVVGSIPTAD